uniref:Ig-like domain-containing protein n=1 Tax=Callorhinchus milii TaxID=7868 RepID=A0A4W3K8I8_CALMI
MSRQLDEALLSNVRMSIIVNKCSDCFSAHSRVELRAEVLPLPNGNKQLVCVSQEFYPPDIQISWFEDGKLITNETYNGTLQRNSDGSFSITSILKLLASEWNETKKYSCHVNHSTLSAPIIERIFNWQ